ncbi:aldehyde dehydrogenase 1A1-like isoform X1 [Diprion similis]|uniref:aldehyde dehydrogenase 1A1-like isoform X1 n=1 Tax=Diprion similis TaxID=362088 RepID=UPI001EF7EF9A|nr:aldehyde dehydrogenase 1A1-like isoform X1 [Diprion similis]
MSAVIEPPKADPNIKVKYTQIFINNEFVDSVSGKKFATVNPCTEKITAEISEGDKADIDKAVAAAKKAFARGSEWRKLDASARGSLLRRLADLIEQNINEFANLESLDNGMPFFMAYHSVGTAAKHLRYYAGWADKIEGSTIPVDGNSFALTRKEPVGVVGLIVPWNGPMGLYAMKLSPALAAGCTAVIKPAEQTPLTGLLLASLVKEAGFPPGVINVVPGYGATAGAAISSHPEIAKVSFTGSSEVGHAILKAAGESNLKRVTLELGGKSPFVVFDDADLDLAVQTAGSLFVHAGQICIAPSRVFVQAGIYDEFVKKAVAVAAATKFGDPYTPGCIQGPQIESRAVDKVMGLIESGKKQGAKLQIGGERHGSVGYFIKPTVFSDVTDDMQIAKEEIFGPVQSILKFNTFEEVVERANATTYGLAAGVFTKNIELALEFAKAVEAGSVWVNQYSVLNPQQPFGGYKQSGLGRELGKEGLDAYLELKTISIKTPTNN